MQPSEFQYHQLFRLTFCLICIIVQNWRINVMFTSFCWIIFVVSHSGFAFLNFFPENFRIFSHIFSHIWRIFYEKYGKNFEMFNFLFWSLNQSQFYVRLYRKNICFGKKFLHYFILIIYPRNFVIETWNSVIQIVDITSFQNVSNFLNSKWKNFTLLQN